MVCAKERTNADILARKVLRVAVVIVFKHIQNYRQNKIFLADRVRCNELELQ